MKRYLPKLPKVTYDRIHQAGLLGSLSLYAFAAQFVKNKVVLDVACGTGWNSSYLIAKGAKEVTGVDISEEAIRVAAALCKGAGLNFQSLNAERLPFPDGFFDVIVTIETLEHVKKYEDFLRECNRVMKQDGVFICSTPNKEVTSPGTEKPVNPDHIKEFSIDELCHLLTDNNYFKNLIIYGVNPSSRRYIMTRKLEGIILRKLFPFPVVEKLAIYANKFIHPHRFRLIRLKDIDKVYLDAISGKLAKPYLLSDDSPPPGTIIVVARKGELGR